MTIALKTPSIAGPATPESTPGPKPLPFLKALPFFLIPALVLACFVWIVMPWLVSLGVEPAVAYALAYSVPNAGLIVASLVAFRLEHHEGGWSAFAARFRLGRTTWKTWAWTLAGLIAFLALSLLASTLLATAYSLLKFKPPEVAGPERAVWISLIILFFNIVGEEIWWRGYIQPRQEAQHGRWAWLVNGSLWACFHMFKPWGVPGMLINCQVIPFVAQRTKSTWPGIVIHFIGNSIGMLPFVVALLSK